MLIEGITNCLMDWYTAEGLALNFTKFLCQFIEKFLMLMLLGHLIFVLKEFAEINEVGIVKEGWIKYLRINVLEKIFFVFSLQSEEELQSEEPFHFLLSSLDIFIRRINFVKVFEGLRHFECLISILIEQVGFEVRSFELVRKRVDSVDFWELRSLLGLIYFAFHDSGVEIKNKKYYIWSVYSIHSIQFNY